MSANAGSHLNRRQVTARHTAAEAAAIRVDHALPVLVRLTITLFHVVDAVGDHPVVDGLVDRRATVQHQLPEQGHDPEDHGCPDHDEGEEHQGLPDGILDGRGAAGVLQHRAVSQPRQPAESRPGRCGVGPAGQQGRHPDDDGHPSWPDQEQQYLVHVGLPPSWVGAEIPGYFGVRSPRAGCALGRGGRSGTSVSHRPSLNRPGRGSAARRSWPGGIFRAGRPAAG